MLNSSKDLAIKRYLSHVGSLEGNSRVYNSRYYSISYEVSKISVRFSDHFSETRRTDINIVKLPGNLYLLQAEGLSYAVSDKDILTYIKSLLLIYPEVSKLIKSLRKSASKASKEMTSALKKANNLEQELFKKEEYSELVDSVYEENKKLKADLEKSRKLYARLKDSKSSLEKQLGNVCSLLGTFKSTIKNI